MLPNGDFPNSLTSDVKWSGINLEQTIGVQDLRDDVLQCQMLDSLGGWNRMDVKKRRMSWIKVSYTGSSGVAGRKTIPLLPTPIGMGRPRLHHSPEDKAAANRAKSKKHYEKYASDWRNLNKQTVNPLSRNKRFINRKRRKEYTQRHQPERCAEFAQPMDAVFGLTLILGNQKRGKPRKPNLLNLPSLDSQCGWRALKGYIGT